MSRRLSAAALAVVAALGVSGVQVVAPEQSVFVPAQAFAAERTDALLTGAWVTDADGNELPVQLPADGSQKAAYVAFNFDIPADLKSSDTLTIKVTGTNKNLLAPGNISAIRNSKEPDIVIGRAKAVTGDTIEVTFSDVVDRENAGDFYAGAYDVRLPLRGERASSVVTNGVQYTNDESKVGQHYSHKEDFQYSLEQGGKSFEVLRYTQSVSGTYQKQTQYDPVENRGSNNIAITAYLSSADTADAEAAVLHFPEARFDSNFASSAQVRDIGFSYELPAGAKTDGDSVGHAWVELRPYKPADGSDTWGEGQGDVDVELSQALTDRIQITRQGDKITTLIPDVPAGYALQLRTVTPAYAVSWDGADFAHDMAPVDVLSTSAGEGVQGNADNQDAIGINTVKDFWKQVASGGGFADANSLKRTGSLTVAAKNKGGAFDEGKAGDVLVNPGEGEYKLTVKNTSKVALINPVVTFPDGSTEALEGRIPAGESADFNVTYDHGAASITQHQDWTIDFFGLTLTDAISVVDPASTKTEASKFEPRYGEKVVDKHSVPVKSPVSYENEKPADARYSVTDTKVKDQFGAEWAVKVDHATGEVTATAPEGVKRGAKITVPVFVNYKDNSTDRAEAVFSFLDKDAEAFDPSYKDKEVKQGESVTVETPTDQNAPLPEGTTFTPDPNTPDWVTVNPDGSVTATPTEDTPLGPVEVTVTVNYPDGSTDTVTTTITVTKGDDNVVYDPEYPETIPVKQGEDKNVDGPTDVPEGTTFTPGPDTPDWVTVNPDGSLTIRPGFGVDTGDYPVTVKVGFPDGTETTITTTVQVGEGDKFGSSDGDKAVNQCVAKKAALPLGIPLTLLAVLGVASQVEGPGMDWAVQANTEIQKRIGVFNPELAKQVDAVVNNPHTQQALGAVAVIIGLTATIATLVASYNKCAEEQGRDLSSVRYGSSDSSSEN